MQQVDTLIVGGGIIGLATAYHLLKAHPHSKVLVLEKEHAIAQQQTGHNSGVIHSGIYYKPGSLKAQNCRKGIQALLQFCQKQEIPYHTCGKLIIATSEEELPRLEELERRGRANGVPGLEMLGPERIREIEPHAVGLKALFSPETGIIDYKKVAQAYAKEIYHLNGRILFNTPVRSIESTSKGLVVNQEYSTSMLINCAGIYADRIAQLQDPQISSKQIIPFRGEYYELIPQKRELIRGLIYPVPDPKFPFLGVHLSKTIEGRVEAGPNAVLALSRVGYKKHQICLKDCWDFLTYKGFWSMALKHWKVGFYEVYRSFSKKAFLHSLQRLVPQLENKDLMPGPSGVRAQVVLPDGRMQDDFYIVRRPHAIHVLNAPSPGATASLAIGEYIASLIGFVA